MSTQLDAKKIMAIVHASVKLGYFKASQIEYSLSSPSSFCAFHSFSDVFDGICKCRRPRILGWNKWNGSPSVKIQEILGWNKFQPQKIIYNLLNPWHSLFIALDVQIPWLNVHEISFVNFPWMNGWNSIMRFYGNFMDEKLIFNFAIDANGSLLKAMTPTNVPSLATMIFFINFIPWKFSFSSMKICTYKISSIELHPFIHWNFTTDEHPQNSRHFGRLDKKLRSWPAQKKFKFVGSLNLLSFLYFSRFLSLDSLNHFLQFFPQVLQALHFIRKFTLSC